LVPGKCFVAGLVLSQRDMVGEGFGFVFMDGVYAFAVSAFEFAGAFEDRGLTF
jgi:hypothetical protein